ncbi:transcription factor bHLH7-like [Malania oleifera]|uniref:transcription factor bHLH7-like n=1 Tax=Malania oleifera TaxID=397392 RepID=UPI0025AE4327|nr:transcription factor bHLH7-like [Malania oleifera]XP_057964154.1 transcription factor bHLH7-like [Malania oleifera]XP_057964155.1 transcription factor bHLH7-like [Malania oleifera]
MERQGGCKNPAQLMPPTLDTNSRDASYLPEHEPNQQFMASGSNGSRPSSLPLNQWTHCQQTSYNHVKCLQETSHFPFKAHTTDIVAAEGSPSPLSSINSANEVSEIQREILCNNSVQAGFLRTHKEGESVNRITSAKYQIFGQKSNEDYCNGSLPHSSVTVAALGFLPKKCKSLSRQRATANDRRRRLRIAETLGALQQLLPQSKEGDKAALLDDIIDHIKFLQLQIKELSRSRLGGESTSDPFVFLEGYGHYLCHEHMVNEPLEEMMGKLLEVNPTSATQLLESRGLSVLPMNLAEWVIPSCIDA